MEPEPVYQVMSIIRGTTVDGPGFRTSIYFAGCPHRCPGCHNPQTWDPDNGDSMTLEQILQVVDEEDFDVTLSGGDPLMFPEKIKMLVERLHADGRNVWLYTGYTWEQICADERLSDAVALVDVIVDGPFFENLRDPDLRFRGSTNQRILQLIPYNTKRIAIN